MANSKLNEVYTWSAERGNNEIKKLVQDSAVVIFDNLNSSSFIPFYRDIKIPKGVNFSVIGMQRGAGGPGVGVEQWNIFFDTLTQFIRYPPIIITNLALGVAGNALWDLIKEIYKQHRSAGRKRQRIIYIGTSGLNKYFEFPSSMSSGDFKKGFKEIVKMVKKHENKKQISYIWDRKNQKWFVEDVS